MKLFFTILTSLLVNAFLIHAQVSGTVFRDYNFNGFRDSSSNYVDAWIKGATVKLVGKNGLIGIALTDDKGRYAFNPSTPPPYRIELLLNNPYDFESVLNTNSLGSRSNIRFVNYPNEVVNFGINYPVEYLKDPKLITPCYIIGDPLPPGSYYENLETLISWDIDNGGNTYLNAKTLNHGGLAPNVNIVSKAKEIGSCWALAIQKKEQKVYALPVLKRHSALGPLGLGALYQIDINTNTVTNQLDLNSIGIPSGSVPSNAARGLKSTFPPLSQDSLAFSLAAKIGFGGMDITEDERKLFIVSLYTKKLYSVFINSPYSTPTAADVDSFSIPDPGCSGGTYRPWAVRVHRGKVYVGVVCDGSVSGLSSDLSASVYEFNPATKVFSLVSQFSLNYPGFAGGPRFKAWSDLWDPNCLQGDHIYCSYTQAILTDIDFDGDDVMIFSFADRYGIQGAYKQPNTNGTGKYSIVSFGDILRARRILPSNQFILENNGNDGINETAGKNTGIGPGFGEYYHGDNSLLNDGSNNENESATGSSQFYPSENGIITTTQDPFDFYSSGVVHLSNKLGNWIKRYEIIPADELTFVGKSTGLGDLKMNTPSPPIQIGNYVWVDYNQNGIQDPIEQPLKNVEIILYQNNVEIARAVSNEMGEYLFSNETPPGVNACPDAFIYGITQLQADQDYQIRIASNQAVLINYHASLVKIGFPNNQQIDNNAEVVNPSEFGIDFHTGINGETNFSLDIGFVPNTPCNIDLGNQIIVSACDPLTNSFNLMLRYTITNAIIGNVVIELSTGEVARHYIVEDGTYNFVFKNIETKGIQNVNVRIYQEDNPACVYVGTAIFNQPESCCNHTFELCSNRSNVVNLEAVPGMAQYRWYKSSDQAVVGFTETLVISNSSPGLEDNTESYYFIAVDSTGDTIRQYCPYQVNLITCCRLNVTTFFQTDCDNNGTAYFAGDDWFSIFITAENEDPGPSSRYEVVVNNVFLGDAAYGTSILVGSSINQEFKADGTSIYKVVIRDIDNHACLDSIFTTPKICPQPRLSLNKSLVSYSVASDGSYNIVYRIDVENLGTETGLYSLRDLPGFDDDIVLKTAFYTSNVPFKAGAALIGPGPWNLISNQLIAPGIKHTFNIMVNFVIDLRNATGDNIYTPCGESPAIGQSLFNRVIMDSDGDGTYDLADSVCANIPIYDIQKELVNTTVHDLRNSTLLYRIVVRNQGSLNGSYSLIESPGFDDDIRITAARFRKSNNAFVNLSLPKPAIGWNLVINQSIGVNVKDTFYVEFDVNLDLRSGSIGDNIYNSCSKGLVPGNGTFNVAGLDLNGDTRTEIKDTTCNDLPSLSHEKIFWSNSIKGVDQNEIVYLFIVKNKGGGQGLYTLKDKLAFDDDIIIQSTQVTVNHDAPFSLFGIDGQSTFNILQNKVINGNSIDSIFVRFEVQLNLSHLSKGNQEYIRCKIDSTGNYIPGAGLFDESQLHVNSDTVPDERDTVCTDFAYYDLAIRKTALNINTIKLGSNIFFRNVVFNQGTGMVRDVIITDYITKAYTFNASLSPGWSLVNDSIAQFKIDSLLPNDSFFIDIVLVLKQYRDVDLTINTSEISSFLSSNRSSAEDIDSYPDQIKNNDNLVKPDSKEDNQINGKFKLNSSEDEDDQDIAQVPTFDIALKKRIAVPPPYNFNQIIPFKITLFNQGHTTIYSSTIIDYLPSGYEFDPGINPDWIQNGNQVLLLVTDSIATGDTIDRFINLKLLKTLNPKDWINVAEVFSASIERRLGVHALTSDLDSEFDNNPSNDMGGMVNTPSDDHIYDDGNDLDADGIKDEDDHDPAVPFIWDLALKKILFTPGPHYPGSKLDFIIRIFNQGTDTMGSITIKDYIPSGLQFFGLDNPDWTITGNIASATFNRTLSPGDSTDFHIILTMLPGSRPIGGWINYAEIVSSKNNKGEDRTGFDIDSKEDSNNAIERGQIPFESGDDDIFSSDLFGNEDDHDPAMPRVLDLALMKFLKPHPRVSYDDTIEFEIEIINQGLIAVDQISIVDYLPLGLEWIPNANWNYLSANRYAIFTLNQRLNPKDTSKIPLKLKVISVNGQSSDLVNVSEIISARDTLGILYNRDIDSQFDFDRYNDAGGIPNSLSDNFIMDDGLDTDGDGIQDEDDADPALVNLVDFALKKELLNVGKGATGDTLNYQITVYNQGNVTAKSITIIDYLTSAYQFIQGLNPNWSVSGSDLIATNNVMLAPGSSTVFNLNLKVLPTNDANLYCNYAEINKVLDMGSIDISVLDADSNPNSNSTKEKAVKPGSSDDNKINGNGKTTDEDDHDVAGPLSRSKLGDMVWEDRNANGIMEIGEKGIANVQVQLFDANTFLLIKNTYTNSSGKYLFEDLIPGKYFIKFIPPTNCLISPSDKTVDSLDSDISSTFGIGTTNVIMLAGAADDRTWDAGLYKCMVIDGYAWYDYNRDGIFTNNENGINGLEVSLYSYPDKKLQSRLYTSANKDYVSRDGYYRFCIKPGSYYLGIQSLSGFVTSPFQVGTDKTIDSDLNNSNGPFTTYSFSGLSQDTLKYISSGIYNPRFALTVDNNNFSSALETRSQDDILLFGSAVNNSNELLFYNHNNKCLRYYNVYRKADNSHTFEKIYTGKTSHTEDLICRYNYTDNAISENIQYIYWIEALDEDYQTLSSNFIYLNSASPEEILIQPNPSNHIANIHYSGTNIEDSELEVRSVQGKVVYYINGIQSPDIELFTKDWPSGIYLVTWVSKKSKIQKLLIVTH